MKTQLRTTLLLIGIWLSYAIVLAACGPAKPKTFTVGIFNPVAIGEVVDGFKTGLANLKYVEGENITYIEPSKPASFDPTAFDAPAKELVDAKVNLIYCASTSACLAAKKATADTGIPVLFVAVSDPVSIGLVQDITKPGGNVTGIVSAAKDSANEGLRLEWLIRASNAKRIFIPYGSADPATLAKLAAVQKAASTLSVELVLFEIKSPEEATAVAGKIPDDVDALFTFSERIFTVTILQDLADAAIAKKLPYSAPSVEYGALISYAPKLAAMGEQSARLADQIFNGIKPADLPVETPEFFLSINLKTAEAMGFTLPNEVLEAANEVVR
jgi:putative ABC transport system substrate-binding protein